MNIEPGRELSGSYTNRGFLNRVITTCFHDIVLYSEFKMKVFLSVHPEVI
jgi:hypothetical protein